MMMILMMVINADDSDVESTRETHALGRCQFRVHIVQSSCNVRVHFVQCSCIHRAMFVYISCEVRGTFVQCSCNARYLDSRNNNILFLFLDKIWLSVQQSTTCCCHALQSIW